MQIQCPTNDGRTYRISPARQVAVRGTTLVFGVPPTGKAPPGVITKVLVRAYGADPGDVGEPIVGDPDFRCILVEGTNWYATDVPVMGGSNGKQVYFVRAFGYDKDDTYVAPASSEFCGQEDTGDVCSPPPTPGSGG